MDVKSAVFSGGSVVLLGGASSAFFRFIVEKAGLVEHVAKTTAPFFRDAFLFGVIQGSVNAGIETLAKKVEKEGPAVDLLAFACGIGSYYAIAHLYNQCFGTRITTQYVHLLAGASILTKVNSKAGWGLKFFSTQSAQDPTLPGVKGFVIFGVIDGMASKAITYCTELVSKKIIEHFKLRSLRVLYLPHLLRDLLSISSLFLSMAICRRYLNIKIPRSYVTLAATSVLAVNIITSVKRHINEDLIGNDFINEINTIALSNPDVEDVVNKISQSAGQEPNSLSTAIGFRESSEALFSVVKQWVLGASREEVLQETLAKLADNKKRYFPTSGFFKAVIEKADLEDFKKFHTSLQDTVTEKSLQQAKSFLLETDLDNFKKCDPKKFEDVLVHQGGISLDEMRQVVENAKLSEDLEKCLLKCIKNPVDAMIESVFGSILS